MSDRKRSEVADECRRSNRAVRPGCRLWWLSCIPIPAEGADEPGRVRWNGSQDGEGDHSMSADSRPRDGSETATVGQIGELKRPGELYKPEPDGLRVVA